MIRFFRTWFKIPIFWIGWPLGVVILGTPLLVYMKIRNQAVPEGREDPARGVD